MNYRINTKVLVLVTVLVFIAAGLFVYTLVSTPTATIVEAPEKTAVDQNEGKILTAKHQYLDGIHTVAGKTEVPTPCHRLVTEPFFIQEQPAHVEIRFSTLLEGEECPSQPFEVPFRVTFEAPEDATITALWNGSSVRLNLVPLAPGEKLEDELYIKG